MVTELRRTVERRTAEPVNHRKRRLIVRMEPGDVLSFREEHGRKWFSAPLNRVYQQVVSWNVEAKRAMRRKR
jgi:hypothetical protein